MNNSAAWNVVITKQKVDNSQQNERSTTKQQHSPSATCVFTNSYMKMGVTLKEISEQVVICMCQLFEIYFFAIATSFTRLQVNSRARARACVCLCLQCSDEHKQPALLHHLFMRIMLRNRSLHCYPNVGSLDELSVNWTPSSSSLVQANMTAYGSLPKKRWWRWKSVF